MYPIGRGKKRTGCVFSRLSNVQGHVENHAQIPNISVMKGGTANIKNRNIFTRGVEVHNLGLGSVDNKMFIPGVHSQPTQHGLHSITGSLVSKVRSSAYNMCESDSGDSPWYTLSNVVNIGNVKGKNRGDRGQIYRGAQIILKQHTVVLPAHFTVMTKCKTQYVD